MIDLNGLDIGERRIWKLTLRKAFRSHKLESRGSECGLVMGSCWYGNEQWGYI